MSYTLGTAAKATGKSKTAIWRAIDSGKISASKDASGQYQIDPAELHRVFKPVSSNETENADLEQSATASGTGGNAQMLALELRILKEERERERSRMQNQIDDLRRRLDDEAAERRSLTALLTYKPEPEQKPEPSPAPEAEAKTSGELPEIRPPQRYEPAVRRDEESHGLPPWVWVLLVCFFGTLAVLGVLFIDPAMIQP